MRVVYWGTYDTGKPRNRIIVQGLSENGVEVIECHKDIWQGVDDKSQVVGWRTKTKLLIYWFLSYPSLVSRYLRLPKHDYVVLGYMGHLDILVLWPFAKLRGIPIVWDAFLSLYNTVVEDRKLLAPYNPLSLLLFCWEWLACRLANRIIIDTLAHGEYFSGKFGVSGSKIGRVFVGAETDLFYPAKKKIRDSEKEANVYPFTVLFYGQYIPLHGIKYIVQAAKLTEKDNIRWILIGQGQEKQTIVALAHSLDVVNITFIDWVPYKELLRYLHQADLCLGVFGDTDKTKRVIPNKVFQIIAAGSSLLTGDTPAIKELIPDECHGISLVPVANAESIAKSVVSLARNPSQLLSVDFSDIQKQISPKAIGRNFVEHLNSMQVT